MDGISTLTTIVFIASGVLNIILFFKVWNMTNDVEKIKASIQGDSYFSCLMKGEKGKAYDILISKLYKELTYLWVNNNASYLEKAPAIIEKYATLIKETGRELPEYLSTPEKFKDNYERLSGL